MDTCAVPVRCLEGNSVARPLSEILDELKSALAEDVVVLSGGQLLDEVKTCLEMEAIARALTVRISQRSEPLRPQPVREDLAAWRRSSRP